MMSQNLWDFALDRKRKNKTKRFGCALWRIGNCIPAPTLRIAEPLPNILKNIEKAILEFDGKRSSIFLNHVNNHDNLNEKEKELVNKIWNEASKFELWNYKDLNTGVKKSLQYIVENYSMDLKACEKMVNAISYEWL